VLIFRSSRACCDEGLLDDGYNERNILSEHAIVIDTLPNIHEEPFDRLLVAQAMVERSRAPSC
jgi:PIN domain nuclease of toxin-antitoxin system